MGSVSDRLNELGWEVPQATPGKLCPAVKTGNLVFTSGAVSAIKGKVGAEVTVEEAYEAARQAVLGCLSSVAWAVGDLDKVTRVVKLLGFVNCAEGFYDTSSCIHGATDALVEIFGQEKGWHSRSAIGVYQLPTNCAVEVELIVEVAG